MICPDCLRSEVDPHHPIFINGLPCCAARRVMRLPAKFRREASERIRDNSSVDYWHEVRARIDVLLEREKAGE